MWQGKPARSKILYKLWFSIGTANDIAKCTAIFAVRCHAIPNINTIWPAGLNDTSISADTNATSISADTNQTTIPADTNAT